MILYHYFQYVLSDGQQTKELEKSLSLLDEEKKRIGDVKLIENFLALRSYAEIEKRRDFKLRRAAREEGVAEGAPSGPAERE
jgi:hypothetical protein